MVFGKNIKVFFSFLFLLNMIISVKSQTFSNINYEQSFENFANPDRGFYHAINNVDYDNLISYRDEGISLVFKPYRLDDYTEGKIDLLFLQNMKSDFEILRKAGMKCIIRFSYTSKSTVPYGDAPLEIVLGHIKQLKPILFDNSDVILTVQAGFIGAWGEWYYTDYFSESPGNVTEENWNDRRTLVDSLLNAVPKDMMVQVRTPNQKYNLLQMNSYIAVAEDEAYSDLPIARIAHHNDCFVAGNNDYGTYQDTLVEKPYLEEDSKYTIVGGETCNQCSESHCENTISELSRFHWSFLNLDYHTGVINDWKDEGCFEDIQKKLGYRFKLESMYAQNEATQASVFDFKIKLTNEGWANPSKKHIVKFILRNVASGEKFEYASDTDLRFWNLNDTIIIDVHAGISETIPEGEYDLLMAISNNENLLRRSEYSIRLANTNCWENETGYNNLNHTIIIDNQLNIPVYAGNEYFKGLETLSQTPLLASTSYGNNNLVSWLRPENDSIYTLLQRSENGADYSDLAVKKAKDIYFIDKNLTVSQTYNYRVKYFYSGYESSYSDTTDQLVSGDYPYFVNIIVDGYSLDWNPIPNTANGIINDSIASVQFYNNSDSLFLMIKAKDIEFIELYIDTDNNGIDNYLLRQDSLFHYVSDAFEFVKKIDLKSSVNCFEASILLSDIAFEETDLLSASIVINKQELWWPNHKFYYMKLAVLDKPKNFNVEQSVSSPYTKLKIKWTANSTPEGYIIEKSIGDSLNFEKLVELPSSTFYFIDEGLDSSIIYYYRVFSYKDISKSTYTEVKWMQPGQTVFVNEIKKNKIGILIAPNPMTSTSVVKLNNVEPLQATIVLYNINGELVRKYYDGKIYPNTDVKISKSNLSTGVYSLVLKTNKSVSTIKILIK